jgi:IS5 family transposase
MLKIVLLAYTQGIVSSRSIERACLRNVQFIAISGDSQPSHSHIAKFVSSLGEQIKPLFSQVLMTCDAQGLIGREMFAIDGVKLPSNASKERSGTHDELRHRAQRLDKAADKIVSLHQAQNKAPEEEALRTKREVRVEALRKEAARTREIIETNKKRLNRKGGELKTNVTDPDSAKMATSKGVIQGYAAQAAVDSAHQVIVAADVIGSGSEQSMLLPMIERTAPYRERHTLITADAGYHSDANVDELMRQGIPAMIADNQMRQRDQRLSEQGKHRAKEDPLYDKQAIGQVQVIKRFSPRDFQFQSEHTAICPAGKTLESNGSRYATRTGLRYRLYTADAGDCQTCTLRSQCLKKQSSRRGRQVARIEPKVRDPSSASERMKRAIDSERGRRLYSQRIGTVEPVFGNLRHNKRLTRLNLRGREKVAVQWNLYCMVHNIEKLANSGWVP